MDEYTIDNCLCCIHPPGDGSTCAGGECCCTDDYTCDKCEQKLGEQEGCYCYPPYNFTCECCIDEGSRKYGKGGKTPSRHTR